MKIKLLLLIVVSLSAVFSITAQNTLKIGHVNIQELAENHPDMDSIRAVVQQETKDMEEIYAEMMAEHQRKLKVFEEESEGYSEFVKTTKQNELIELVQKIQNYSQLAEQQLQQRNRDLIRPIYEEINQEITNIAGKNNFTYIIDFSNGSLAYMSPDSEDITSLVLSALNKK
jgi:outer membrane protein